MTAHVIPARKRRRKVSGFLLLTAASFALFVVAAAGFVLYVLWPTWPGGTVAADAPPLPVTVAGVLFEVPPGAIRTVLQRHPGPHERIDLAFAWPSLQPPQAATNIGAAPPRLIGPDAVAPKNAPDVTSADGRLFVTIVALGSMLPPDERLREVYPHYAATNSSMSANGLAILPFRAGTPYDGQDLVYRADRPDRFFVLCTRDAGVVPGMCIDERAIGGADVRLRFPRKWLDTDWHGVASGLDRLMAEIHPPEG